MQNTGSRHGRRSYSARSARNRSQNTFFERRKSFGSRSDERTYKGGGRQRNAHKQATFNPYQFINKHVADEVVETYTPTHQFGDFGLCNELVRNLGILGLTTLSPIQDQIIPEILQGNDVVGIAETGTGKTAAFLLPLIEKTLHNHQQQTLVLTPTRELAIQIEQELRKIARGLRMHSTVCVGGASIRQQIQGLGRHNHFVIGTPGRIIDLADRGRFLPERVTTVVLDEADRMLDMGFIVPIRKILGAIPQKRETLFFSATMDHQAQKLVSDFLKNPVIISVKKRDIASSIRQDVVRYAHDKKFETLERLLREDAFKRVLVFGAMKHSVEGLAKKLSSTGVQAESIHGNKSHGQRQRALASFKNGNVRVLVATDVAARGIHVDNISHVINYDLPSTFEDYIHRIGRTGRADRSGQALKFIPA